MLILHSQNINIIFIKKFLILFGFILVFINATTIDKKKNSKLPVSLPNNKNYNIPYLQKDFVGFKEALAFKESQGKYRVVNTLGYLVKY